MPPFALDLIYLVSAVLFALGLKRLGNPSTARSANVLSATGMLLAILGTLLDRQIVSWGVILGSLLVGGLIGVVVARTVKMTAMPQLVGAFNGLGGGASALLAAGELLRIGSDRVNFPAEVSASLGILIGGVTLSGSFLAVGKLQEILPGRPITYPFQRTANALLFLLVLATAGHLLYHGPDPLVIGALAGASLLLGVTLVLPIGGADMPVVISLLNSYSGLAVSAAGFAMGSPLLILVGALVGAAGLILTQLMCRAMNRSLFNVAFGAFGGVGAAAASVSGDRSVRSTGPEEAALLLAYASSVVIVPGYGLAVAQAQHEVKKLTELLRQRGVQVRFAIHPVAGRMPGHMNVLLAEADIPYDLLIDMEEINADFPRTDVAVVVGANDVVNPLARDPSSQIAGMPILEVDRAQNVIVIKRSLGTGFAGIDNPLFYLENTMMYFSDAKEGLSELAKEVRAVQS